MIEITQAGHWDPLECEVVDNDSNGDTLECCYTRWQARTKERLGVSALVWGMVIGVWIGAMPTAARAQRPATAVASLVFDRVTVVDVEQGKLVPDQRVVIAGNRIQAVGTSDVVEAPQSAQMVEAKGKYLIPGLWDLHVHTKSAMPYRLLVANGITGIRDGWSSVPLDSMVQWWKEILAGKRIGPPRQLLTGDRTTTHQGETDELTEDELRDRKASGANFIKLYPFSPRAAALVNRVGLPFGGHLAYINILNPQGGYQKFSAFEASDSGMRILDHLNTSNEVDVLCWGGRKKASAERCRPLVDRFRKNGTWWAPTLLTFARPKAGPLWMGPASLPVRLQYEQRMKEFLDGSLLRGNWLQDSGHAALAGLQDSEPTADTIGFLRIMHEVGMPIVAGTDTPLLSRHTGGELLPGFSLHAELAIYVAEGLTPLEALQSATINPARMLRGTDSLGTVAPGKLADLVLLDADPLADITNTTTIRAVVANGRYFDRTALDQMLSEVQAAVGGKGD